MIDEKKDLVYTTGIGVAVDCTTVIVTKRRATYLLG